MDKLGSWMKSALVAATVAGATTSLAAGTANAVTLKDARGRSVVVKSCPQRIASSSLASDEILVALLQRTGGMRRLVAVSTMADNKSYSNIIPVPTSVENRIGGELESTVRLKPDLVLLAAFNRPELISILDKAGISTFALGSFASLTDISNNILTIGRLIHEEKAGRMLQKEYLARLDAVRNLVASARSVNKDFHQPRVLSFYSNGTVAGAESTLDAIIAAAGGSNIAGELGLKGWPKMDVETLVTLKPDFIVTPGDPKERDLVLTQLGRLTGWKDLAAVKAKKIILVPEKELGALSHHVIKAVERLAVRFHPEIAGAIEQAQKAGTKKKGRH